MHFPEFVDPIFKQLFLGSFTFQSSIAANARELLYKGSTLAEVLVAAKTLGNAPKDSKLITESVGCQIEGRILYLNIAEERLARSAGESWFDIGHNYELPYFKPCAEQEKELLSLIGVAPKGEKGSIKYGNDSIEISLRRFRNAPLLDGELTQTIYLYQILYPGWRAVVLNEFGIFEHIIPNSKKEKPNPLEWASRFAADAYGLGLQCHGRDYPLELATWVGQKIAPLVCNASTDNELVHKISGLSSDDIKLIRTTCQSLGELNSPEITLFVTACVQSKQNSSEQNNLLPDIKKLKQLARVLPAAFENGLRIGSAIDLFKQENENIHDPERATNKTIKFIKAVFCGANRPWWFNENVNLCSPKVPYFDGKDRWLAIAKVCGFAFDPVRAAILQDNGKLFQVEGLSFQAALDFYYKVTLKYGLASPLRTSRICLFAITYLNSIKAEDRASALDAFGEFLTKSDSPTEVISKLEDDQDRVTFSLPGMLNLSRACLGELLCRLMGIDDSQTNWESLTLLANKLSEPLVIRQSGDSVVIKQGEQLLKEFHSIFEGMHSIENDLSMTDFTPKDILEGWMKLDNIAGDNYRHLIPDYLAFIAPLLPNPFDSPSGLFQRMDSLYKLPTPLTSFFIPNDHHEELDRALSVEIGNHLGKRLPIHTLLRATQLEIITWNQALKLLDWVLAFDGEDSQVFISQRSDFDWDNYDRQRRRQEHSLERLALLNIKIRELALISETSEDALKEAYRVALLSVSSIALDKG